MASYEDSVRVYLREIGRVALLTVHQEIEYARDIRWLLQAEEVYESLGTPPIAVWAQALDMSEAQFKVRLKKSQYSKDRMVRANLRLVVSIAKRYNNRGLPFQDLIQEGSLGLIRAAEKFNPELGFKFSTYATWWVRQAITRAIADQSRTIRLPVHLYETLSRIKTRSQILAQEHGRKPSDAELAEAVELDVDKFREIIRHTQLPLSLEMPIGEEDSVLGDFLMGDGQNEMEKNLTQAMLRSTLEKVISGLADQEQEVIRLRYGLKDGKAHTLEEIGDLMNTSRERIRQIEAKALRKLKQPARSRQLVDYVITE